MPRRSSYDPFPKLAPTPTEPVMVHLRRPPVDSVIRRHRHSWGQLNCPRFGSIRVSVPGTMWIVPRYRAVWIPPGIEHEVVMQGEVEFHALYVEPTASPLPLDRCAVVEVSRLMRELVNALADDAIAQERRRRMAMSLLVEEIREAPSLPLGLPLPEERRLRALCMAMMEDPGSENTLQDWAPIVGASARTLARLFHTELQTSFGIWRRQLRLARAIDLIGRNVPLADVATEVGYANAPAFSTMFRSALGFPPSHLCNVST
ncbi:AraC family transcriptional regulator [Burkholderia ubonensis]|nr:AraC family transcriptional regulator [Burkholderia ubonensis]KVC47476.1 AraC family transcriptional regulator [Burkholderia ubonensis]KVC65610.1 AraC family transcriptional regulator [Burkholderia ubonensis]KVD96989.1 AraC family transcriptional regulator [Burkholderia ubonensis]